MRWVALVGLVWAVVCGCSGGTGADGGSSDSQGEGLPPPFQEPASSAPDCPELGSAPCDLVTGCGCATGEACRADAASPGAATCMPLAEHPHAPYAQCESDLQCPALHSCIDSVCKKMCREAADCGWSAAQCLPTKDASGTPLASRYCARGCDVASPQAPDPGFQACGAGLGCVIAGDGTDCIPQPGSAEQGAACKGSGDCAPGLYCSNDGECQRWCKLGADDCTGERCVAADPAVVAGGASYGRCTCQPPPGAPCDPGTGCGCAQGTSCGVVNGSVGCRPIPAGAQASGARCSSDAQCPARQTCFVGTCHEQCTQPEDCTAPGSTCLPDAQIAGQLGRAPISGIGLCTNDCDPAAPQAPTGDRQSCPSGQQCYPFDAARLCASGAGAAENAACQFASDCAPGLFCGSDHVCWHWCEVGSSDCGAGRACRAFGSHFSSGRADGFATPREYGYCACAPANGDECDPSNDCGCDRGGTCDYNAYDQAFECRAIADAPSAPGAACSDDVSCPALHTCLGGVCRRLCAHPEDCTGNGSRCEQVAPEDASFADWKVCTVSCDPLSPSSPRPGFDACPAGAQCVLGSLGSDCSVSAGAGVVGSACGSAFDCAPGSFCGLSGTCEAFCEIGAGGCPAGLECKGFDFLMVSAGRDFGRCTCTPSSGNRCDFSNDCGCDPGTSCTLASIDETVSAVCAARPSMAQPYALCEDDLDCPALYSCLGKVCRPRCASTADCSGTGVACNQVISGSDPVPGFRHCSRHCSPVSPSLPPLGFDACGSGTGCFPFPDGLDCIVAGAAGRGEACSVRSDCQPGLFCDDQRHVCLAWCQVGANDCPAPQVCVGFSSAVTTASGEEWGQCTLCSDECGAPNEICEDGGPSSASSLCPLGSDCSDCGAR